MMKLFRREAMAYLRLGLISQRGGEDCIPPGEETTGGRVLFIPGVGATGAHFLELREALSEAGVRHFETFEYASHRAPGTLAEELGLRLQADERSDPLVIIGHSLGGVLATAALQNGPLPPAVAGLVTLGSPLHGNWRSRFAPWASLRELRPDSAFMTRLAATRDRLRPLLDHTLSVAATRDQLVQPAQSALLDGAQQVELDGVAHAGLMFDRRVHRAVVELVRKAFSRTTGASPPAG